MPKFKYKYMELKYVWGTGTSRGPSAVAELLVHPVTGFNSQAYYSIWLNLELNNSRIHCVR